MSRVAGRAEILRSRIAAWQDELQTNLHGMRNVATQVIAELEAELAEFMGAPQRRAEQNDSAAAATTPESGGTRAATDAWEEFLWHIKHCRACVNADANGILCRDGDELHNAWKKTEFPVP